MQKLNGFLNRDRAFRWFACIAIIVAAIFLVRFRFKGQEWHRTITSDGSGYYAYLPAFLLYQDPQYRFYLDLKSTYGISDLSENFLYSHHGRYFNRYFAGTAVAITPFFGGACFIQAISGGPLDGHHPVFVVGLHVAGLFYALAGLYALYRLLLRRTKPPAALLLVGAIFFGTNLWNYAVNQPAYSHVYSFAFIAFFLLSFQRFLEKENTARLAALVSCLGMITLIRPSNLLIIGAIPIFFSSLAELRVWMIRLFRSVRIYGMLLLFLIFPAIQSLLYHVQCGAWWVDGYPYEHFDFLRPHLWEIWIHPRAGMLLYSPILILIFVGWFSWIKRQRFAAISWIVFMLAATWIISSWWAWHYAGTIGMRAMTDHLPWLILPMSYLTWPTWSKLTRWAFILLTIPLLAQGASVNYQAFTGILPHDHMTTDKYVYLLGETRLSRTGYLDDRWYPAVPKSASRVDAFTWNSSNERYARPLIMGSDGCVDTLSLSHPLERRAYVKLTGRVRYASLKNESRCELRFYSKGLEVHRTQARFTEPSFETNSWNETTSCFLQDFGENAVDEVRLFAHLDPRSSVEIEQIRLVVVGYK